MWDHRVLGKFRLEGLSGASAQSKMNSEVRLSQARLCPASRQAGDCAACLETCSHSQEMELSSLPCLSSLIPFIREEVPFEEPQR